MDSNLQGLLARLAAAAALLAAPFAHAFNHTATVNPIAPGRFVVACSNVAQDASRIAPGLNAADYWEGRFDHYITELLTQPQTALVFNAQVPDVRRLYPRRAGDRVPFAAIVCHPTSRTNTDANYTLPMAGTVPRMQLPGAAPKLISQQEYATTLGIQLSPAPPDPLAPQKLPLIVYSHGLGGSPISSGYIDVMVQLAAQGFMVAGVFHGDSQFSRIRIEDLSDFAYLLLEFDRVVEMMLMRPVSLKAMLDTLLANPGFAAGVDQDRIGGFGASLGGQAMAHLLGARITASLDGNQCEDTVQDPRIKAVVGYVPYAGHSFLPAFCKGNGGADRVTRPYMAITGSNDTTAPNQMMEQALNHMKGSRYFVELVGGEHELRTEDAGDIFTWMVSFYNAYLDVRAFPNAMPFLIKLASVNGGRTDRLLVDVHVPGPAANGQARALEFYNTVLDHYFIAYHPDEVASILTGGAGAGWITTGEAFKVFPQMPSDTFTAVAPVCRFYGRPAGGPNSHFFTASGAECEIVKRNGGWYYEGTGFHAMPVPASGECPTGWLAVQRAYNNGYPRNDSNHRFTTSDSTLREMGRRGWAMEGNVMCALP